MNQKSLIAIFGIVVIVLIGTITYFLTINKASQSTEPALDVVQQPVQPVVTQPTQVTDETVNWKVFTSKQEGFTLKYPTNWILQDGDTVDCGVTGAGCPDRVTFTSPDGLMVRYVKFVDTTDDKLICGPGTQAPCFGNKILGLETLDVQNFGQVYLVKESNGVSLDVPLSKETTPVIGENKHSNFDIYFSLPSRDGGRYLLFTTASFSNEDITRFNKLTTEQFYNLESVKQAIIILKSIKY